MVFHGPDGCGHRGGHPAFTYVPLRYPDVARRFTGGGEHLIVRGSVHYCVLSIRVRLHRFEHDGGVPVRVRDRTVCGLSFSDLWAGHLHGTLQTLFRQLRPNSLHIHSFYGPNEGTGRSKWTEGDGHGKANPGTFWNPKCSIRCKSPDCVH